MRVHAPTCLWRWNRQSVPKRRYINFRRRGINQKKTHNIQYTAKVWNQEKELFSCAHEHLPGYMNQIAELPFPHMIWFSCLYTGQLYAGVHCYAWVVPKVALRWQRGEIDRQNEHADSSKSVSSIISTSKKSFSCKISTNYEQPGQSVLESQPSKESFSRKFSTNYEQPRQSVLESQRVKNHSVVNSWRTTSNQGSQF